MSSKRRPNPDNKPKKRTKKNPVEAKTLASDNEPILEPESQHRESNGSSVPRAQQQQTWECQISWIPGGTTNGEPANSNADAEHRYQKMLHIWRLASFALGNAYRDWKGVNGVGSITTKCNGTIINESMAGQLQTILTNKEGDEYRLNVQAGNTGGAFEQRMSMK